MTARAWIPPSLFPGLTRRRLATLTLVFVALYGLSMLWPLPLWALLLLFLVGGWPYSVTTDKSGLSARWLFFSQHLEAGRIREADLVRDWRRFVLRRRIILRLQLESGTVVPVVAPRWVVAQLLRDLRPGLRIPRQLSRPPTIAERVCPALEIAVLATLAGVGSYWVVRAVAG